jgi:hypothetical protein
MIPNDTRPSRSRANTLEGAADVVQHKRAHLGGNDRTGGPSLLSYSLAEFKRGTLQMTDDLSSNAGNQDDQFKAALVAAHAIKAKYVDPRLQWYKTHTMLPRVIYRLVGISTIILSVTLPALTAAQFQYKELVVSGMSILIAALTGLGSFYHWDRTWRGNSTAQVSIEQYVAKWELELARAQQVVPAGDRISHIYKATDDLLANAGSVVSSESQGFFSNLQSAQQNSTGKV